jgi:putative transposase
MTNHLHALVTPSAADSLPGMMQSLGRVYVQYFNDKYRRTGTLWEGRYKATVVQDEAYLLTCMRYIELNPVRAGMADAPARYEWSSHRANALGEVDQLTSPHPIFRGLGATSSERHAAYRELFGQPLREAELRLIREATQKCWALGDDAFRQRVSASGRRAAPVAVGRPRKPERAPCRSQQRKTRV